MTTPTIGPDPKIARKIYAALDEHFDDKRRVYHGKYSDALVAKELDIAVKLVENIRREAYGELAEDPVITGLRDEARAIRAEIESAETAMMGLIEDAVAPLKRRLEKLEAEMIKAGVQYHKANG